MTLKTSIYVDLSWSVCMYGYIFQQIRINVYPLYFGFEFEIANLIWSRIWYYDYSSTYTKKEVRKFKKSRLKACYLWIFQICHLRNIENANFFSVWLRCILYVSNGNINKTLERISPNCVCTNLYFGQFCIGLHCLRDAVAE